MYKFQIFKGKDGHFYVHFVASNGEKMFVTQGYKAKESAKHAIESIKQHAAGAVVEDEAK